MQNSNNFLTSCQLLFVEESLFWITGWYILKSHKLRRVTLFAQEPPAIHVIQNLFFLAVSFLLKLQTRFESHKSYLLQQELFGASPPPATGLKYIWFQNVFHKFLSKELTSDVWANFRDVSWCLKKRAQFTWFHRPSLPPRRPSAASWQSPGICRSRLAAKWKVLQWTELLMNLMVHRVFWDCDPHTTLTAVLALVSMKRRLFSSA